MLHMLMLKNSGQTINIVFAVCVIMAHKQHEHSVIMLNTQVFICFLNKNIIKCVLLLWKQ